MNVKEIVISALMVGAIVAVATLQPAKANLPLAVDGQLLPSLAPMIDRVQASLVRISVSTPPQARRDPLDDPFFRRFFDQRRTNAGRASEVFATGVVVDGLQGLILVNEHSVRGVSKVKVTLDDGRDVDGQVLGTDSATDVALIKVDVLGLTAIAIADSNSLRVGDFVVSIGDPLGEENTLVTGLISALARNNSLQAHQNFIRSDAAAGPGILVNLRGEMVGLNIAKSAQTAGNLRIGFSTPVNMALRVKEHLVKFGTPQRGFLAVQVQDLTPDLARVFNIRQAGGAVISNVIEGSSADKAGLEIGDVVLEAGTQQISRSNDLRAIIGQQFAGDILNMTVAREGGKVMLAPVLESSTRESSRGNMLHHQLEGATFKEGDMRQVSTNVESGVLVSQVRQGSVAWEHGVRANDIIVSANRKSVTNMDSLRKAIEGKQVLMLNIVRGNGSMFLLLQ
ncbi:MAG: serine protease Do/serine protease DegQ [Arenicella sp.]